MTCDTWRTKLDAYVDAELDAREQAGVEAHLHGCSSCAADALTRMQLKRATSAAGRRYAPSPEFSATIRQQIAPRRKPRFAWGFVPTFGAATAVTFIALLIASGLWLRHSQREQVFSEVADVHVTTLASSNPLDVVSTDRHTVKPWFQGKLPFTFNLPELSGTEFTLAGGRMAYVNQSPGAELMFAYRKHQISAFVLQDRGPLTRLGAGPIMARKLAFNVETWSNDGLRYFVVGDAAPADIHALAELLRRAAHS